MLSYEGECRLCPRKCGVKRLSGERGFCRMGAELKAARAAAHFWEEPVISGQNGSGTVFFSGCTLRCIYCQNAEISCENYGKTLNSDDLRAVFERLVAQGAENINLVTPTHFLPTILPALTPKLPVPVVYNCGGYESVETLRELESYIDIYLPDMKYSDNTLAAKLSAAPDYFETADAAICEMVRQVGAPVIENGQMKRGVLVRHLVLPGCVDNSLGVLDWFSERFPSGEALFSLMRQYTPIKATQNLPPFDRKVSEEEYDAVLSYLMLLGIEDGFVQDEESACAEFTPPFDLTGV